MYTVPLNHSTGSAKILKKPPKKQTKIKKETFTAKMHESKSRNPVEQHAAPQVAAAARHNGNSDWQNGSNTDAKSDSSLHSASIRVKVII